MTEQNEQNVQNVTETPVQQGKKEQIVHWGVKLPVSVRDRLAEMLADWKSDPGETQATTVVKLLDAATMAGHEIPEEVQRTTGETRDAVMVLLKRINSIGATAALTVDDLHKQLAKQIAANDELQEKHKKEIDRLTEQNKSAVETLKDQLKTARDDSSKIIEDYSQLKARNEALQAAQKAFEGQIAGLEDRNDELKQELKETKEALKQETLKLEDTVDTCNLTVKNREEELKKELADVKVKADAEMQNLKQNHQIDLQRVQAREQAKAAEKVAQLQSQLFDKFAGEKEKLANEKSDLKAQVASLQAELKALKEQFDQKGE